MCHPTSVSIGVMIVTHLVLAKEPKLSSVPKAACHDFLWKSALTGKFSMDDFQFPLMGTVLDQESPQDSRESL